MKLKFWSLGGFAGTMAPRKNLSATRHLGISAAPTFYFGTPSISP